MSDPQTTKCPFVWTMSKDNYGACCQCGLPYHVHYPLGAETQTTTDLVVPHGWLLTFIETSHQHRWQPVTMENNIVNPEAIQHAINIINKGDDE